MISSGIYLCCRRVVCVHNNILPVQMRSPGALLQLYCCTSLLMSMLMSMLHRAKRSNQPNVQRVIYCSRTYASWQNQEKSEDDFASLTLFSPRFFFVLKVINYRFSSHCVPESESMSYLVMTVVWVLGLPDVGKQIINSVFSFFFEI